MFQFKMYVFATTIGVCGFFFRPPVQNLQSELLKHTIDLPVALKWGSIA